MTHVVPNTPLAPQLEGGDAELLKYARSIQSSAVLELEGWFFRPVTREQPHPLAWYPDVERVEVLEGAAGGAIRIWGTDFRTQVLEDEDGEVELYEDIVCFVPLHVIRRPWAVLGYIGGQGESIMYRPAGAEEFEEVLSHYKLDVPYAPYDPFAHGGYEFVRFL